MMGNITVTFSQEQMKELLQRLAEGMCDTIFADEPEELKAEFLKRAKETTFERVGEQNNDKARSDMAR